VRSTDRIELVRRFHEAWIAGNLDLVLECIDPEMEFDWSESRAPFRGVYRGHEGMRKYWDDVQEAWERFSPELDDIVDCGDGRLVTRSTVRGIARSSGIELAARGAMLWTVRDDKIVGGKLFQTAEEAMQAAGRAS
jgi:ketosteroid isomerase-like protein